MIGYLRGKLVDKRTNQVLVDVNGVGYVVSIPLSTFYALGELHEEVTLLVHTHLREDSIALYGFLTAREKQFFELLISASGVGPSLALKILSGMSVDEFVPAIWCASRASPAWGAKRPSVLWPSCAISSPPWRRRSPSASRRPAAPSSSPTSFPRCSISAMIAGRRRKHWRRYPRTGAAPVRPKAPCRVLRRCFAPRWAI